MRVVAVVPQHASDIATDLTPPCRVQVIRRSTTLIGDVPVEGVEVLEEFVYLGSTQSSDGYC